jgi:SPOR domain
MSRVYEALKKAEQERATVLAPEPAFPFAAEATQIVDRTVRQSREPTQRVPPDVLIPKHPAAAVTLESACVGHQRRRKLLVKGLTGSIVVVAMVASVILLGPRRARITEFVGDLKRSAARGAWIPRPVQPAEVATSKLIAVPQQPQPHFAVQIGAFPDRARAEALASHFSRLYQQTILVGSIEVRGKTLYRVRLLVRTKASAEALANSMLREQRLKAWIVALP